VNCDIGQVRAAQNLTVICPSPNCAKKVKRLISEPLNQFGDVIVRQVIVLVPAKTTTTAFLEILSVCASCSSGSHNLHL
jgi:hypothetical protein